MGTKFYTAICVLLFAAMAVGYWINNPDNHQMHFAMSDIYWLIGIALICSMIGRAGRKLRNER